MENQIHRNNLTLRGAAIGFVGGIAANAGLYAAIWEDIQQTTDGARGVFIGATVVVQALFTSVGAIIGESTSSRRP